MVQSVHEEMREGLHSDMLPTWLTKSDLNVWQFSTICHHPEKNTCHQWNSSLLVYKLWLSVHNITVWDILWQSGITLPVLKTWPTTTIAEKVLRIDPVNLHIIVTIFRVTSCLHTYASNQRVCSRQEQRCSNWFGFQEQAFKLTLACSKFVAANGCNKFTAPTFLRKLG